MCLGWAGGTIKQIKNSDDNKNKQTKKNHKFEITSTQSFM